MHTLTIQDMDFQTNYLDSQLTWILQQGSNASLLFSGVLSPFKTRRERERDLPWHPQVLIGSAAVGSAAVWRVPKRTSDTAQGGVAGPAGSRPVAKLNANSHGLPGLAWNIMEHWKVDVNHSGRRRKADQGAETAEKEIDRPGACGRLRRDEGGGGG